MSSMAFYWDPQHQLEMDITRRGEGCVVPTWAQAGAVLKDAVEVLKSLV